MKIVLIISFLFMVLSTSAQSNNDMLINQTYIAKTGFICQETPGDNPCAGLEVFLILNFKKEFVSILEKKVSTCGVEKITSKFEYKWKLIQNHEIEIYSNPKEISYHFLKDFVLKIESEKVVGYKKRYNNNSEKFEFKKTIIK